MEYLKIDIFLNNVLKFLYNENVYQSSSFAE